MASPTDRMTQPPDDAALLIEHLRMKTGYDLAKVAIRAATALEVKDRRIETLEAALTGIAKASGERVIIDKARAALEPSDKGVDHVHPE